MCGATHCTFLVVKCCSPSINSSIVFQWGNKYLFYVSSLSHENSLLKLFLILHSLPHDTTPLSLPHMMPASHSALTGLSAGRSFYTSSLYAWQHPAATASRRRNDPTKRPIRSGDSAAALDSRYPEGGCLHFPNFAYGSLSPGLWQWSTV
jgi:hypothetical protein